MTRTILGEMSLFPLRYGKVNFTAMLSPIVIFRLIKFYIYKENSVSAGLSKKADVLPCITIGSMYYLMEIVYYFIVFIIIECT